MGSKILSFAALAAATTIAACGGGSSSEDGGKSTKRDAAKDRQEIAALIKQAYGPNEKANSGKIDGTIDITVKGVPRYKGTTEITQTGSYDLPTGSDVPEFNLEVGLVLNDHAIGGSLVLVGGNAFIALGDTGYKIPSAITSQIVAPATSSKLRNGLVKTAGMFHIRPDRWQKQGYVVGDADVAGVQTTHATAGIHGDRFFADVARLVNLLTLLRVTQSVGLPTAITPKAQAALARSVTFARGDVYLGKSDHVLRKAHLEGRLVVAKRDRKLLEGMTSAKLVANFTIDDVGAPQHIAAPRQVGSYADLQLTLDALGESIRNALHGK